MKSQSSSATEMTLSTASGHSGGSTTSKSPTGSVAGPSSQVDSQVIGRPRKSLVWEYFTYEGVANKSVCQIVCSSGSVCGKYSYTLHIYLCKNIFM